MSATKQTYRAQLLVSAGAMESLWTVSAMIEVKLSEWDKYNACALIVLLQNALLLNIFPKDIFGNYEDKTESAIYCQNKLIELRKELT